MRITQKGQVTIPQNLREKYGFLPDTEIEFFDENGVIYLKKSKKQQSRALKLIAHMSGKATVKLTTDQILALTRGKK